MTEQPKKADAKVETESAEKTPAETKPADELPEEIELTPEIVEDEAIRNDFMLRLAVVLLAVLVACTEINESRTLVHVKTGQYLANNGILPPRTDVFAHTATEEPWINLSWLFDLFSAGSFAAGGAVALTVVKSLLAGVAFYLVLRAVRRDVPTWWASICAGLAVIVCTPQFTFETQMITLLGLSLTLWLLMRFQQSPGSATLWPLLPVFVIWSNMDARAYLGLVVLMLLTLGELLGMLLGRSCLGHEANRAHLWMIVPLAVVAFMIHPFLWNTLLSPARLYLFEYPAWREIVQNTPGGTLESFLPLYDASLWKNLTFPTIAALVLAATVPVTFALNWRNVTPAHGLLYLGMAGIGLANSHDLAAVSLVFAVLAAANAQEWYAESFRQAYSVELSERFFSVGGRAVTAIAIFGVAFLAITGRLLGKTENRLGLGFDEDLSNQVAVLRTDLEETEIPGNPLNFSLSVGDVLIWLDHQPFIDSRLSLFTQGGSDSLYNSYRQIIETWRNVPPEENETQADYMKRLMEILEVRQTKLKEFAVAHAIVPVGPRVAQYERLRILLADQTRWRMVRLSSMAGWFYRLDPVEPPDVKYLEEHQTNFAKEAFRSEKEGSFDQPYFSTSPTFTDKLFSLKAGKANAPNMLLALHQKKLMEDYMQGMMLTIQHQGTINDNDFVQAVSLAHLAMRNAQEALKKDPNSTMSYQVVADCSMRLSGLEQQVGQVRTDLNRRYYQAAAAYNQAIIANPEADFLHLQLAGIYRGADRFDLAVRELNRYFEISPPGDDDDEAAIENYERLMRLKKDMETAVERVQKEVDSYVANNAPTEQIAAMCYRNGCVLMALKYLEQDGEFPQNDPGVQLWRLEAGQVEDAYLAMLHMENQLESELRNLPVKQFTLSPEKSVRNAIAIASLAVGDYERAIKQWTRQSEEAEQMAMLNLMGTLPMANRPLDSSQLFMRVGDDWGFANWMSAAVLAGNMPSEASYPLINAALSYLEIGQPKKAEELFRKVLKVNPSTDYRQLVGFYLLLTANERIDPIPPTNYIPVWEGMFAPSPAVAEKPKPLAPAEK